MEPESTGPTGATETVESTGPTGAVETTGPTGTTEATGMVEATGTVEATGPTGTVEATGPTGTVEATGPTGTVEATGPTGTVDATGPTGTVEATEPVITIESLMATQEAAIAKEEADRQILAPLLSLELHTLNSTLLQWARGGFTPIHPLMRVSVSPPPVCSDGVSRSFLEYVEFLIGGTVAEKMAGLQTKMRGMTLSYSLEPSCLTYHVSKD